ncbi:MAG: aconitase X swivel domain-containing protein [Candidatus Heimdallarchaeaceae archaeon]
MEIGIRPIVEGKVTGSALLSPSPISFLGDVDSETGKIIDSESSVYGKNLKDTIFVFPRGKGSTVGSYIIYGLKVNNVSPLALVVAEAETIVIAGAILADIPLVDLPDKDLFSMVKTGDTITIDTSEKTLKIQKMKK